MTPKSAPESAGSGPLEKSGSSLINLFFSENNVRNEALLHCSAISRKNIFHNGRLFESFAVDLGSLGSHAGTLLRRSGS